MGINLWKSDYTSGEVSALLQGQVALKRYASGALKLTNCVVHVQGGVSRRAGTAFVNYTRGGQAAKLVPFIFNEEQAYVLEFTSQCIRIYHNRAAVTASAIGPAGTLTLTSVSGTPTATSSVAAFDTVTNKDIGRFIEAGLNGGKGMIYQVLSTTQAKIAVHVDFEATSFGAGGWQITGVPVEVTTPYTSDEVFELRWTQSADTLYLFHKNHPPAKLVRTSETEWSYIVVGFNPPPVLEFGDEPDLTLILSAASGSAITGTASGIYFLEGDVGRIISGKGGAGVITSVPASNQVIMDVITTFPDTSLEEGEWRIEGSPLAQLNTDEKEPKGRIVNLTLDKAGFRTSDAGKYVSALDGSAKIISITSPELAKAQIIAPFSKKGAAVADGDPAGAWTLNENAWSARFGYPSVGTLGQQRLWAFSTLNNPLTFWASETGNFEGFTVGSDDDRAITRTIASGRMDVIRWAKYTDALFIGTIGGEFRAHGGAEAMTPSNLQVDDVGTEGSAYVPDAYVHNNVLMFIDRSRRVIREFWLNADNGLYMAIDLGKASEHLFRDPLRMVTMARAPEPYIIGVSETGRLLVCAYDRNEQVVGWTPFETDGEYIDTCVIPVDCGDEVWVCVKRNGQHMLEFFDGQLRLDSAVFYTGASVSAIRGLVHLEGEAVKVLGDLTRVKDVTVANGEASLTVAAAAVQAGLPFSVEVQNLPPEVATNKGSSQGRRMKYTDLTLRLLCTDAVYVNPASAGDTSNPQSIVVDGEDFALTGQIDRVVPGTPFSGDARFEGVLGWSRRGQYTITVTQPVRFTLVGAGGVLEFED